MPAQPSLARIRIIMLRAHYIHYIRIYSRSEPAPPNPGSFGSGLGAVWVRVGRALTPYYYYFFDKNIHTYGTNRRIDVPDI